MGRKGTARRRLAGAGLASVTTDTQLELGNSKTGFPPGMTVDELRWYSRRRTNDDSRRQDNLYLESGSLKDITSEYTRCFKAPPVATYSLSDLTDTKNDKKENVILRRFSSQSEDALNKFGEIAENKWHRRPRKQNLKLEGDMLFQTENGDEFIEYILEKRPDLLRRDTNLKLEGDIDTKTENQDKFIAFNNYQRLPLLKRDSNLHLEGDHLYKPEYRELFIEFPRKRPTIKRPRPWLHVDSEGKMNSDTETLSQFVKHATIGNRSEILIRPTNLKCEGDRSLMPEYRDSFREYPIVKQYSIRQTPTLKLEGDLYTTPEYKEKYTTFPTIKINQTKHFDNLKYDDDVSTMTDFNKSFTKPPSANLNLPIESGITVSTDNTALLARPPTPTKAASPDMSNFKQKSEFANTRNKSISSYPKCNAARSTTPVEERLTGRPPRASRTRTTSQSSPTNKRDYQKETHKEIEPEYTPQYTSIYDSRRRMRQPEPLMDDSLESQPEYRKAYLDYLIREKLPRKLPSDTTPEIKIQPDTEIAKGSALKEKRQMSPNKTGLSTYQPTLRRGSTTSVLSSPRRRSSSPSYRLHVTNVDEPKKGFGALSYIKSDTFQKDGHRDRKSIDYNSKYEAEAKAHDNTNNSSRSNWIRNIAEHKNSNTTGYDTKYNYDNKSFVVLDNFSENKKLRRKMESPWWRASCN